MLRTLLLAALAALVALLAASTAAAAPTGKTFTMTLKGTHTDVWEYNDEDYPDTCKGWRWGRGTQEIKVRTLRPQVMRIEDLFGRPHISTERHGRYGVTLERVGRWKENAPGFQIARCSPCGPLSELGPCEDERPPRLFNFQCGFRKPKNVDAGINYAETKLVPHLGVGLIVNVWMQKDTYFKNCPPEMDSIDYSIALQLAYPEWTRLPKSDTDRLTRIGVGETVTAKALTQRYRVDQDGLFEGKECVKSPDVVDGFGECAVTEFEVVFRRIR